MKLNKISTLLLSTVFWSFSTYASDGLAERAGEYHNEGLEYLIKYSSEISSQKTKAEKNIYMAKLAAEYVCNNNNLSSSFHSKDECMYLGMKSATNGFDQPLFTEGKLPDLQSTLSDIDKLNISRNAKALLKSGFISFINNIKNPKVFEKDLEYLKGKATHLSRSEKDLIIGAFSVLQKSNEYWTTQFSNGAYSNWYLIDQFGSMERGGSRISFWEAIGIAIADAKGYIQHHDDGVLAGVLGGIAASAAATLQALED